MLSDMIGSMHYTLERNSFSYAKLNFVERLIDIKNNKVVFIHG